MNRKEKISFFKKEIIRFLDFFSLHNWEIFVFEQKKSSSRASCGWHTLGDYPDGNGKMGYVFYGLHWIDNPDTNKNQLSKTAFHEVFELLLANLRDFSENNKLIISHREIDNEIHSIIRIMENKVFPLIKK